MAKWKRSVVGSILKSKPDKEGNPQPDYISFNSYGRDALVKALMSMESDKNLTLKLESKKFQLDSVDEAVKAGRLSEENAEAARERISKMKDFVRFDVVLLTKE